MFFEPLPPGERAAAAVLPEVPPWSGPPELETGAVLAVEQTVVRSPNVVLRLPTIRAFSSGYMIDVDVISRRGGLPEDDWWDLRSSAANSAYHASRVGAPLPRKLMRLGVRYADGRMATTIEQPRRTPARDDPPGGPLLSWRPRSSGMHGRDLAFGAFGLWVWPLPPAEAFEFAVEWPFGGIELTIIELDGAAIVAAAGRSVSYWTETEHAQDWTTSQAGSRRSGRPGPQGDGGDPAAT